MRGDALWTLQAQRLRRGVRQTWAHWRASVLLVMGGYVAATLLVGIAGLWLSYRGPAAAPDPLVLAALASAWWWSGTFARRPALALGDADGALLGTPAAPWRVWLGPLASRLAAPLGLGVAVGTLLWAWFPPWWAAALGLPLLGAGRVLVQALAYDARTVGDHTTRRRLLLLGLLPLLGGLHPAALPPALLVGVVGLGWLWHTFWRADVPPVLAWHGRVEALRQGARRLGLPALDLRADGTRAPRRWVLALRGSGAFRASVWRSGLHVLRRPGLLLWALPAGALVAALSPALGLDPTQARACPTCSGRCWARCSWCWGQPCLRRCSCPPGNGGWRGSCPARWSWAACWVWVRWAACSWAGGRQAWWPQRC